MSEEKQFAMSMYTNKESLYKAKSEYYLNIADKLLIKNAAQAQEIDELKAHVNDLCEAITRVDNVGEWRDGYWCSTEKVNDRLDMVMGKTPAQSLAAHEAAQVKEVIKCSIMACETEKVGANEFDDRADVAWDDAVTSCISAIRNMPRKYNA